jgi:proteasome accessory factor C
VFSTLGNWYVRAHCRLAGGERVFRVDRIRSAEATETRFEPPEAVPPPLVEYTPGADDVRAVIRLDARARWVADYYPVEVIEDGDELVVRFSAPDAAVTARLLLRLGPAAELVDGDDVAAELADLRSRIIARYDS